MLLEPADRPTVWSVEDGKGLPDQLLVPEPNFPLTNPQRPILHTLKKTSCAPALRAVHGRPA
ncbi:hypothetical protein CBM2634_U100015 [Cupriavidus taiwanensis]|uniref:Uncharacterized protein n=1 Tax=Cupriavidus taiwanensis TaxID=164546 RepID=A0A375JCG2_9BURK|nr:hypothetical protein CBM2634_U100015 [Cupriavidus taiwanensis]